MTRNRKPAAEKRHNGKIDPAAVAFDIDGVIADTMGLFLDIARREYGINNIRYADITCYDLEDCLKTIDVSVIDAIINRIVSGNYTIPLKPVAGAPEVLRRLSRRYRPILLVTARPHMGPIPEWVQRVLYLDPSATELVATGSFEAKAEVLQQKNIRFFVEDRLETCFSLEAAGIEPVVFKQPWNRTLHPFREVGTWHELESLMEF